MKAEKNATRREPINCEQRTESSCYSQQAQVVAARNKARGDMKDASPAAGQPRVEVSRHPPQTGRILVDAFLMISISFFVLVEQQIKPTGLGDVSIT